MDTTHTHHTHAHTFTHSHSHTHTHSHTHSHTLLKNGLNWVSVHVVVHLKSTNTTMPWMQHVPEEYEKFAEQIPEAERHNLLEAYYRRLVFPDRYGLSLKQQTALARVFIRFESICCKVPLDAEAVDKDLDADEDGVLVKAQLEAHYFAHGIFVEKQNQVIDDCRILQEAKIPCGNQKLLSVTICSWFMQASCKEGSIWCVRQRMRTLSRKFILSPRCASIPWLDTRQANLAAQKCWSSSPKSSKHCESSWFFSKKRCHLFAMS